MNRKFIGFVLILFFGLVLLVIVSRFISFGRISSLVYTLFILVAFYLILVLSRKIKAKKKKKIK